MRTRDEPVATEIDAVTAWRGWSLVEEEGRVRLSSLTRAESWMPRAPHAASCSKGRRPMPQRRCRCGIYATTTPEALGGLRSLPGGVVGEVSLWGRVIEHGRGYRAEIGYPGRLGLVCAGCLAEGTGRRAEVVQRLESRGRTRLLPWCSEHAPATVHAAARVVESELLSTYAVDPVSDEMIERIHPKGSGADRHPEGRLRNRLILMAAALVVAIMALLGFTTPRAATSPAASLVRPSFVGPKIQQEPSSRMNLGPYASIKVIPNTVGGASGSICGHAENGVVRGMVCRAEGVNVYVFDTVLADAHGAGACTERADFVTSRGHRLLCWRRVSTVG